MKKLFAICFLAIMLIVAGCCAKTAPDGTTTKSLANCFAKAEELICNPSDQVKADAAAGLAFIQAGLGFVGGVTGLPVGGIDAVRIFTSVQAGVCVGLKELQAALAYFDSLAAQVQTKETAKGMKAAKPVPSLKALRAAAKK